MTIKCKCCLLNFVVCLIQDSCFPFSTWLLLKMHGKHFQFIHTRVHISPTKCLCTEHVLDLFYNLLIILLFGNLYMYFTHHMLLVARFQGFFCSCCFPLRGFLILSWALLQQSVIFFICLLMKCLFSQGRMILAHLCDEPKGLKTNMCMVCRIIHSKWCLWEFSNECL